LLSGGDQNRWLGGCGAAPDSHGTSAAGVICKTHARIATRGPQGLVRAYCRLNVGTNTSLSFEQREQLATWFAEGRTVGSVATLIRTENERGEGLAPWPSLSRSGLQVFQDESKREIAVADERRLDTAINRGLGKREQQAAFLVENIGVQRDMTEAMVVQFQKYVRAGALDLDVADLVQPRPDPPDLIDAVPEGRLENPPDLPSALPYNPEYVAAVLKIKGELFNRALKIANMIAITNAGQAKAMEVLGRVTATIDLQNRIDLESKQRKAAEVLDMLRKHVEAKGITLDDLDTSDDEPDLD